LHEEAVERAAFLEVGDTQELLVVPALLLDDSGGS